MSLLDCDMCWHTPCMCGYDYQGYSVEGFAKFIADIMSYKTIEERKAILKKAGEIAKTLPVAQEK